MTAIDVSVQSPAGQKAASMTNRGILNIVAVAIIASNAIWAAGLALPAALAVFAGCAGLLWLLFSARAPFPGALLDAPVNHGLLARCFALGVVATIMGGEAHLLWAFDDWLTRDAVLADVVRHGWTTFYNIGGDTYFLRAPLGIYMAPGLIGHFFGLKAAHFGLLIQNAALFGMIFYLVASLGGGLAMAVLLIVSGGFDIIPWLAEIVNGWMQTGVWATPGVGVQWWAGYFQYTAHFVQIVFVPNHAIPGWFFALLAMLAARRELDIGTLGAGFAALIFWSPLGPLAALPFLCYFAWRDRREIFTSGRLWLGAAIGACFLPVALYLVTGAGEIGDGWLIHIKGFWPIYFLFLLFELPQAFFVLAHWARVRAELKPLLVIGMVMLVLLPLYSFGPGNDLTMRASIVPLFLFAFSFSSILLTLEPEQKVSRALGWTIVAIGSAPALFALGITSLMPHFEISACNLVTASAQIDKTSLPANYIAPTAKAPDWLVRQPSATDAIETVGSAWCWPDHPTKSSADKVPIPTKIPR